jgi:hypothetical protein
MSEVLVFNFLGLALIAIAVLLAALAVANSLRHRQYYRAIIATKYKVREPL